MPFGWHWRAWESFLEKWLSRPISSLSLFIFDVEMTAWRRFWKLCKVSFFNRNRVISWFFLTYFVKIKIFSASYQWVIKVVLYLLHFSMFYPNFWIPLTNSSIWSLFQGPSSATLIARYLVIGGTDERAKVFQNVAFDQISLKIRQKRPFSFLLL